MFVPELMASSLINHLCTNGFVKQMCVCVFRGVTTEKLLFCSSLLCVADEKVNIVAKLYFLFD